MPLPLGAPCPTTADGATDSWVEEGVQNLGGHAFFLGIAADLGRSGVSYETGLEAGWSQAV